MMTGRHTAETKERIRAALKGRPRPQSVRDKIAATKTGKKLSAKHRLECRVGHRVIKLFKPEAYATHVERSRATMLANWQNPAFIERWKAGRETFRRKRREKAGLTRFTDME